MVVFYVAIPLGLVTKNSNFYGLCFVWIIYTISSCNTNTTKYISNTVNVNQVFTNIERAIAARPECRLHIQNYHYEDRVEHYTDKDGKR